jgi:GMP synthase (glutamine-hydrolysing)
VPGTLTHKVLLIVHSRTSDTGRVGRILGEWGYELDVRCPCHGCVLPQTMDEYDGAVIFGGPQSVYDCATIEAIQAELNWIPKALDAGKPFLGVCLGGQMLAHVLGAKVSFHPAELHEIGFSTIRPLPAWKEVMPEPTAFYQWHKECFDIPCCAERLAEGDMFPNQAFRVNGHVYGLQFHPEVTESIIDRWTSDGSIGMTRPEAQPRRRQLADSAVHEPKVEAWTQRFLDHWIGRPGRNAA